MIHYVLGKYNLLFALKFHGSVVPKAFILALPNALISVGIWFLLPFFRESPHLDQRVSATQVWVAFNFIIGFMVSFRTNQAYARWWEAAGLLQQARSEWFNAYSNAISFTTTDPNLKQEVDTFQQTLVRLMSLLHTAAMHQICKMEHADFEILDTCGLDRTSMEFLRNSTERCEVLLQWIQRLTVLNINSKVLPIPPPIMARMFMELSRGFVSYTNARRVTEFQFPFACAQMVSTMIVVHWCLTPFISAMILDSWHWAGIVSFIAVFSITSVNDMANSIELPFGDQPNDLPLQELSRYMNKVLLTIIDKHAQTPPALDPNHQISRTTGEFKYWKKPRVAPMVAAWNFRPSRLSDFIMQHQARPPLSIQMPFPNAAKYFIKSEDEETEEEEEEQPTVLRFLPGGKKGRKGVSSPVAR